MLVRPLIIVLACTWVAPALAESVDESEVSEFTALSDALGQDETPPEILPEPPAFAEPSPAIEPEPLVIPATPPADPLPIAAAPSAPVPSPIAATPPPAPPSATPTNLTANPGAQSAKVGASLAWSYSQSLSNGSFVANFGARNPTWANYLLVQPAWRFDERLAVSLRTTWNYEFSKSDLANGRRFAPDDWVLNANWSALSEKADGVSLLVGPQITLPVSFESRFAGRWGGLAARALVSRTVFGQSISFLATGTKWLNSRTSAVLDATAATGGGWDGPSSAIASGLDTSQIRDVCLPRGGREFCAGGDPNASWSMSGLVTVAGELPVEGLSYVAMYRLATSWRYARPIDEYTPAVRDVDGRLVADGSARPAESSLGYLGLSWAFAGATSVDLYFTSFQPALRRVGSRDPATASSWALRFPFWDFTSPANNFSSVGLGLSGSI